MFTLILGVICTALAVAVVYLYTRGRRHLDYKDLFLASEKEYKAAQEKIQALLVAEKDQVRIMDQATATLDNVKIKYLELAAKLQEKIEENEGLQQTLAFEQEQYGKLIGQKKSSEVRTGKIAEQLAPFLEDYPLDPETARFIGNPIDFVHFDKDQVTFVEVKSGKSQLSTKQRQIRELIKSGKVNFIIYRISGNGPTKR